MSSTGCGCSNIFRPQFPLEASYGNPGYQSTAWEFADKIDLEVPLFAARAVSELHCDNCQRVNSQANDEQQSSHRAEPVA
jgi:hypothetical protein